MDCPGSQTGTHGWRVLIAQAWGGSPWDHSSKYLCIWSIIASGVWPLWMYVLFIPCVVELKLGFEGVNGLKNFCMYLLQAIYFCCSYRPEEGKFIKLQVQLLPVNPNFSPPEATWKMFLSFRTYPMDASQGRLRDSSKLPVQLRGPEKHLWNCLTDLSLFCCFLMSVASSQIDKGFESCGKSVSLLFEACAW